MIPASPDEQELPQDRFYTVKAELFPTAKAGVNVGYTRKGREGNHYLGYEVAMGASWYFRHNIGLDLTLTHEEFEGSSGQNEGAALRVTGRF